MTVLDKTRCLLGEGPLWHPERKALFWFDILANRMLCKTETGPQSWQFDQVYSAAGWVDSDTLLIASETGLWRFDIVSGARTLVASLEADNAVTRSNDGRADPWGGFWIGTMGKNAEADGGAIYRFYRGEVRKLYGNITTSNAICFAPDRSCAYFTDTPMRQIMRVALANDGWPSATPEVFIDLSRAKQNPDGAVTDAQGNIWIALWGGACVTCIDATGKHKRDIAVPARHPTCPAFGGPDLRDLMVTSAKDDLVKEDADLHAQDGMTFCIPDLAQGLPEPQVIL